VAPEPFQYAVLRLVPRVEREEFINVGVIVFCRTRQFLRARVALDPRRVAALAPGVDLDAVAEHLDARVRVAAGDTDAGPIAALPQSERFHWLVAPSSTVIQTSSVHSGLCDDPESVLERLFAQLVAVGAAES
jgi:pimeloyl-ACP methyl ester carboxylesterase